MKTFISDAGLQTLAAHDANSSDRENIHWRLSLKMFKRQRSTVSTGYIGTCHLALLCHPEHCSNEQHCSRRKIMLIRTVSCEVCLTKGELGYCLCDTVPTMSQIALSHLGHMYTGWLSIFFCWSHALPFNLHTFLFFLGLLCCFLRTFICILIFNLFHNKLSTENKKNHSAFH